MISSKVAATPTLPHLYLGMRTHSPVKQHLATNLQTFYTTFHLYCLLDLPQQAGLARDRAVESFAYSRPSALVLAFEPGPSYPTSTNFTFHYNSKGVIMPHGRKKLRWCKLTIKLTKRECKQIFFKWF